ncbi:MAG: hypothetical protein M1827_000863 [Pycnora praestabilis]|nr:MAG: hypothetical protein M1827_000863 [Pycnora praestabilis]
MRQYPSMQTMRRVDIHQSDDSRTPTQSILNGSGKEPPTGDGMLKGNGAVKMNGAPQVQVIDFEATLLYDHHGSDDVSERGRSRKIGSPPIVDPETVLREPDNSPRAIHIPTRTSSKNRVHRSRSREANSSFGSTPISGRRSPRITRNNSYNSSVGTYETGATSLRSNLPALQAKGQADELDQLEPLLEDDPQSFDLVAPGVEHRHGFSLETRAEQLFSREHLQIIFSDPPLLFKFTTFLSNHRPQSVQLLVYYIDTIKALKAINYANAVAESLEPIEGQDFTSFPARDTVNSVLEEKARQAFDALVREDLPAYITYTYTQIVSLSVTRRITGTLAPHLREASEGLAEVFCLTDYSRPDNPIVFASEEFHRTTQYGMDYVIGRNCRFLQGPKTSPSSIRRFKEAVVAGKEQCEVFLNYRRDGSPFMNLLMIAPLCDSRGLVRYFIGAQIDVSGMAKECTDLESLQRLVDKEESGNGGDEEKKDELQALSEMFNMDELETIRRWGGHMHREHQDEDDSTHKSSNRPRLLLKEPSAEIDKNRMRNRAPDGKLSGVYQNYLLVRPYPSLRILFTSPSLRVPGILQSPFMDKIGGSARVRDDLTDALASGRGVTAKVRWVSRFDDEGRPRWIHCTPLLSGNGAIGVWMVIIVDGESERREKRMGRLAPPVQMGYRSESRQHEKDGASMRDDHSDRDYDYFPNVPGRGGGGGGERERRQGAAVVRNYSRNNGPDAGYTVSNGSSTSLRL